jgi:hypothetical protein
MRRSAADEMTDRAGGWGGGGVGRRLRLLGCLRAAK